MERLEHFVLGRLTSARMFVLALLLVLPFQGSRGLWESDEGRYTQVARMMIQTGDWVTPHRHHHHIHATKPPLTYWSIAASLKAFGENEWAARLPNALAFAFAVLCVFWIARVIMPKIALNAALIYTATPLSFLAANIITTDSLLTAFELGAMACFVQWYFGAAEIQNAGLGLDCRKSALLPRLGVWLFFALAFLTKGPPALLPLFAILVFLLQRRDWRSVLRLFHPLALLLFAVVGLPWYIVVIQRNPELLDYFLRHEVVNRIASSEMGRNPQWWGGLYVYGLSFLIACGPWSWMALSRWRMWFHDKWWARESKQQFLLIWLLLPLAVFLLAKSRLPFYILPLVAPFVLLLARSFEGDSAAKRSALVRATALTWLVLLTIKITASFLPHQKDMRQMARAIQSQTKIHPDELVFLETTPRYGLGFYFQNETEWVSMERNAATDDFLQYELREPEGERFYLMKTATQDAFVKAVKMQGMNPIRVGEAHGLQIYRALDAD